MNSYRFGKSSAFLGLHGGGAGKQTTSVGEPQGGREATVPSTASFLQLSEVGVRLQKLKSKRQLGRTHL